MKLKLKDKKDANKIDMDKSKSFFDYTKPEQEKMYDLVREYLYEFPGKNAIEVSEATGVPRQIIMTFVRQGRVSIVEGTGRLLNECRICGGVIEEGDICPECKRKVMINALQSSIDEPETQGKTVTRSRSVNKKYGHRRLKNR